MATAQAKQSVTDELEVGNKLNVSVSASGSASIRLFQGPTQLSATQLAAGSSTDFGPFINSINYAVDCYSGTATTTETQSNTKLGEALNKSPITASRSSNIADDQSIAGNNTASNYTITVEANTIPNGFILEQLSTGTVTVAAGTGVTFIGSTLATSSAGQTISILPTSLANTFIVKVA
jgi:hypothetical protein